jgi:malic enzyme
VALVDSHGLVHVDRPDLDETKRPIAMSRAASDALGLRRDGALLDTVQRYRPGILVGITGVPGTFTRDVIRAMAATCDRPIVMPLSNPTAIAEARPADVMAWTAGRAIIATGSPFTSVAGRVIGQANNVFIFPGLGLGAIVSEASRISDSMVLIAARTLAGAVTADRLSAGALYPPIAQLRAVSRSIALAVARDAISSGLALPNESLEADLDAAMWWPAYVPYTPARPA